MTFDQLLNSSSVVWEVVKIFYLLVIALFGLFSVIIIRQVYLMTATVKGSHNLPLKTISFLFLGLVIVIFLIALVMLP